MIKRIYSSLLSLILMVLLIFPNMSLTASAQTDDPMIIVSLGDSYSSGEGIPEFYDQRKDLSEKINSEDWLAHRSTLSWPGLLSIDGYGLARDARKKDRSRDDFQWYFGAVSGAKSFHIYSLEQEKPVRKSEGALWWKKEYNTMNNPTKLPKQIDIFDKIEGGVDYVTMTIGGNDVGFAGIIEEVVMGSSYLQHAKGNKTIQLELMMNQLWDNIETTKLRLKSAYEAVELKAGPQATIIIAGYPKLLAANGAGAAVSKDEARIVNKNVSDFNDTIEELVGECQTAGMKIEFVGVESIFEGHEAYTSRPWINEVILFAAPEDLDEKAISSAYSMHPNADGAVYYAQAVSARINDLERQKKGKGTLSGRVCKASNNSIAIPNADIRCSTVGGNYALQTKADNNGNFSCNLEEGAYLIEVSADGYVPFTVYTNVVENENTYLQTCLMVEGEEGEEGTVNGIINNSLTGGGVPTAHIEVRKGWDNTSRGDVISSTDTDEDGKYSVRLPLGNYTLYVSKPGFIPEAVNITVQRGTTNNQNGSITPVGTGEDYRIVLTWGENPRDLDSHVAGKKSNGVQFHVYYAHKSEYDEEVEICNLDVDDTTSYGPETVTLKADQATPYYYYIHHFAGTGTIATSGARINVYQGGEHIAKFDVPTDLGSGIYWNVFAIVNGRIVGRNTMTDSPETAYAGNGLNTSLLRTSANSLLFDGLLLEDFDKDSKSKDDELDAEVKEAETAEITEDAQATEETVEAEENAEETEEDSEENAEAVEASQDTGEAQAPAEDAESEQAEDTENPVADAVTEEPAVSASEEASEAEEEASEESSTVETPAEQAEEDTEAAVNP